MLKVDVDVKCLRREHPGVVQRCAERRVCADIERVVPPDEISAYGRADYEQNYENDKCCFQSLFHADSSMTGYDNDIFYFTLRSEYSKIF